MSHPEWAVIIDKPEEYLGNKVHVVGWKLGTVFQLIDHSVGVSTLKATKSRKTYLTRNALYKLRVIL